MSTQSSTTSPPDCTVAVIGAGPSGLYAARKLAEAGVQVLLLNRDIKPGGLAEYGIYPTKHKMKEGLRRQFRKILTMPQIRYYGGVSVGANHDIALAELDQLGCDALLFCIGAQGTRSLGLPGEDAHGVLHAKDLVYHFNQLPPFASQHFPVGQRVGIVGMGNVMIDVANWLISEKKVEEVVVFGRRGPAERAYTDKEMREVIQALDLDDLDQEMARISTALEAVGQDPAAIAEELRKPLAKAYDIDTPTRFRFRFLTSPTKILSDANGQMIGIEAEHNILHQEGERTRPKGTGEQSQYDLDTLIFAIGDQVDPTVGLPFAWGKYLVPEDPHPVHAERARYEVFDPDTQSVKHGWFVAGWARQASDGLVGKARVDGETGALEVLDHINTQKGKDHTSFERIESAFRALLDRRQVEYVTYAQVQRLEAVEQEKAASLKRDFFKFDTNAQMLTALQEME